MAAQKLNDSTASELLIFPKGNRMEKSFDIQTRIQIRRLYSQVKALQLLKSLSVYVE